MSLQWNSQWWLFPGCRAIPCPSGGGGTPAGGTVPLGEEQPAWDVEARAGRTAEGAVPLGEEQPALAVP